MNSIKCSFLFDKKSTILPLPDIDTESCRRYGATYSVRVGWRYLVWRYMTANLNCIQMRA